MPKAPAPPACFSSSAAVVLDEELYRSWVVAARTRHLRVIIGSAASECPQVLVLGVGLDSKPLEFASAGQRWFLADLRDMLRERANRLATLGRSEDHAVHVALDLRSTEWPRRLVAARFDPDLPTLVVIEALSMYLERAELRTVFDHLRGLLFDARSLMWFDRVSERLLAADHPEVRAFRSAMARSGANTGSPYWCQRD